MKLEELFEENKKMKEHKDGTYAGVNFSKDTVDAITAFIKKHKIPNAVAERKLHTTLLYSRKPLPDYKPEGKLDPSFIGKPEKFEIWKTRDSGKNALVLKYDCDDLIKRHKFLMKEHEATYDFDEFIPHITLSYDIGDMTLKEVGKADEIGDIEIVSEYSSALDLDWAQKDIHKA